MQHAMLRLSSPRPLAVPRCKEIKLSSQLELDVAMMKSTAENGDLEMIENLKKKVLWFRKAFELPPFDASTVLHELLLSTLKDLEKKYHKSVLYVQLFDFDSESTHQVLSQFYDVLRFLEDLWLKNHFLTDKMISKEVDTRKLSFQQLVEANLQKLEDMDLQQIKELFDLMEKSVSASEPDQMQTKQNVHGNLLTPTTVLPQTSESSRNLKESPNTTYISPVLPLDLDAVGKLSPMDRKRLSFHLFPLVLNQRSIQVQNEANEVEPDSLQAASIAEPIFDVENWRYSVSSSNPFKYKGNDSKDDNSKFSETLAFTSQPIPILHLKKPLLSPTPTPPSTPMLARGLSMIIRSPKYSEMDSEQFAYAMAIDDDNVNSTKLYEPSFFLLTQSPSMMAIQTTENPVSWPTPTLEPIIESVSPPSDPILQLKDAKLSLVPNSENKSELSPLLSPQTLPDTYASLKSPSESHIPPCGSSMLQPSPRASVSLPPLVLNVHTPPVTLPKGTMPPPPPPPPPNMATLSPKGTANTLPPPLDVAALLSNGDVPLTPPLQGVVVPPPQGAAKPPEPPLPGLAIPAPKGAALPPPPPSPALTKALRAKKNTSKLKRSTKMGNMYRLLKRKVEGTVLTSKASHAKRHQNESGAQSMADALAEMTKRSAYFRQIEEDVENFAETILKLKSEILLFETKDMTELLRFHQYVEKTLENLSDETQVLSRFEGFPSKKLDMLRMASALNAKLDSILSTLKGWKLLSPVAKQLDKVESYFNKIKEEMEVMERSKEEESKRFQSHKIEFDFNVLTKIKECMVDLSSNCIELALKENKEAKEMADETTPKGNGFSKILWRAFQLAFRVYNFAGGQDDRAEKLTSELAQEIESQPQF